MKSKRLLYAFAGLLFVGGLAFAFSSTDMFKGTFDLSALRPAEPSGIPAMTPSTTTSTATGALFDLRWDSDLSYDEDSNQFSASMCIDDGTGDPSFTDDVLVDYYVYNDEGSDIAQSGVFAVTDFHKDPSNSAGDCEVFDIFEVDESVLDDSVFRVSIALRFSQDADASNDGRGKDDLIDSDVVSGTNLMHSDLFNYDEENDVLDFGFCYEGEELVDADAAQVAYLIEKDGLGFISGNFQNYDSKDDSCYYQSFEDFSVTYPASIGDWVATYTIDTNDHVSFVDGDDTSDNEQSKAVSVYEQEDEPVVNIVMEDAYVIGVKLYAAFSLDSEGASQDFMVTASVEDQEVSQAFTLNAGESFEDLLIEDLSSAFELNPGDSYELLVRVDSDETVSESDEEDNSFAVELNEEKTEQLYGQDEESSFDYEETARAVVYEGYGLDEDQVEEELRQLIEEAQASEMSEEDYLDALDKFAASYEVESEEEEEPEEEVLPSEMIDEILEEVSQEYQDREALDEAVEELRQDAREGMNEKELREEAHNRFSELEELSEGLEEDEVDNILKEIAREYEGREGLDKAMDVLKEEALEQNMSEKELREEAERRFSELEEEEIVEETAVEETVEVAVQSIELGEGRKGLTEDEKAALEEVLEEAIDEGTISESDVQEVVEELESEVDESDDTDELIAALEAAIQAANAAASSASSAASAAQSAASSAASSGSSGSSSGSQDVVVNIDLGDYVSDSGSSTASTGTTSTSSSSTETVVSNSPFSDVEEGTWYGDAMIALNEAGIMEGSNGKAYPWEYGNRAELVVLVMRSFYDESVLAKMDFEHEFEDVSSTKWYAMYLSAAVEFDILEAKDEFRPSESMTRAEFVTVLVRAANQLCTTCSADFTDIDQGDWYYRAIATALSADLVSGYEDGSFKPNSKINRAQVASILYKALMAGWLD